MIGRKVSLEKEDSAALKALARSRTAPANCVERAAIILELAAGRGNSEVARALGIDRQRVARCARRAAAVGAINALDDLPRSGRRPTITAPARAWIVAEACVKPKERDYPHELWTLRLLAAHLRSLGPAAGHTCLARVAPSTVWAVLNAEDVKPHKIRYYLERRDPDFDNRMEAVVEVYAAARMLQNMPAAEPPVAIVSYDEKPGIQAIATTAPDLPPVAGKHPTVQRDHEYRRLGTLTLAAAVDLVTGRVHHAVTERHRSREFIEVLKGLDAAYPADALICVLLDNHSAHRSRETRRFLDSCPGRFEFVFTPKHASWLNWVEIYFSKIARSLLRHIRVDSKDELRDRINRYIKAANEKPLVPKWAFRIDQPAKALAV
jgi:transposase